MKNAVLRAKIQRTIVIDPDSGFRQIWDVTQVVSHRKERYFRARPLFPSESSIQRDAVCRKMTFSSMANAGRPARLPLDGDALPDRLRRLRAAALGRDVLVHACHGHVLHRR